MRLKHLPSFPHDCFKKSRAELHGFELVGYLLFQILHFDVGSRTSVSVAFLTVVVGNLAASRLELFLVRVPFGGVSLAALRAENEPAKQEIMHASPDQKTSVLCEYVLTRIEQFFCDDGLVLADFRLAMPSNKTMIEGIREYAVNDAVTNWRSVFRDEIFLCQPFL